MLERRRRRKGREERGAERKREREKRKEKEDTRPASINPPYPKPGEFGGLNPGSR
jgi:hypothetical protein